LLITFVRKLESIEAMGVNCGVKREIKDPSKIEKGL